MKHYSLDYEGCLKKFTLDVATGMVVKNNNLESYVERKNFRVRPRQKEDAGCTSKDLI